MSDSKRKSAPPSRPDEKGEAKQSGRVAFDGRGNSVWEWQTATGKFDRNVSTQRLKKLEAKDLSLMDTASIVPNPSGLSMENTTHMRMPGDGTNPYDSALPAKPSTRKPNPKRQSLVTKLANTQPKQAPQSAWSKLKQRFFK